MIDNDEKMERMMANVIVVVVKDFTWKLYAFHNLFHTLKTLEICCGKNDYHYLIQKKLERCHFE
jgi:hypothetical protein